MNEREQAIVASLRRHIGRWRSMAMRHLPATADNMDDVGAIDKLLSSGRPELDLRKIEHKFTEIVAGTLHYEDRHSNALIKPQTAAEVNESINGWLTRYHHDAIFNARVQKTVAMLMGVISV